MHEAVDESVADQGREQRFVCVAGTRADEPLLRLPNVIASPHLGFVERTSYETLFGDAFDNVVAFAAGQPRNIVNAAVLTAR